MANLPSHSEVFFLYFKFFLYFGVKELSLDYLEAQADTMTAKYLSPRPLFNKKCIYIDFTLRGIWSTESLDSLIKKDKPFCFFVFIWRSCVIVACETVYKVFWQFKSCFINNRRKITTLEYASVSFLFTSYNNELVRGWTMPPQTFKKTQNVFFYSFPYLCFRLFLFPCSVWTLGCSFCGFISRWSFGPVGLSVSC